MFYVLELYAHTHNTIIQYHWHTHVLTYIHNIHTYIMPRCAMHHTNYALHTAMPYIMPLRARDSTLHRSQYLVYCILCSTLCNAGAAGRGAGEEERRRDEGTGGTKEGARVVGGKATEARLIGG
jgi:hypothetical protein